LAHKTAAPRPQVDNWGGDAGGFDDGGGFGGDDGGGFGGDDGGGGEF
jgi:hypothetical protein